MTNNLPLACILISLPLLQIAPVGSTPSILAQTLDAIETQDSYDRLMQLGYEATKQREYQTALQHFQEALAERPNDFYAQQAVENIESYLERSQPEAKANFRNLMLLAIAFGGGSLILLLWFLRHTSQSQDYQEENAETHSPVAREPEPSISNRVSESQPDPQAEQTSISTPTLEPEVSSPSRYRSEIHYGAKIESSESQGLLQEDPVTRPTPALDLVDELIQELDQADSRKRRRAIWELTQRGDSRAVEPLVERLIQSDSQERSLILEALTRISARTLQPMNQALTVSLEDDSPQVRQNAIREMTQVYELMSQVNNLLSLTLNDPDAEVQETAHWALNQIQLSHLLNADIG